MESITASIIQGSAVGPFAYDVVASDLHPIVPGNCMTKFADDTYVIVPEANSTTCQAEIDHIEQWAMENNLKLNRSKTYEIILRSPRRPATPSSPLPPEIPGIKRVTSLKCLGVTISQNLHFSEHVSEVICSAHRHYMP